ncbi:APC family permease [Brevibacillus fluminis]|uniref:APC family permease n=1 Tax=Brevibacillus fluminis TaxID=511487 RepID=A0A3M8CWP4_9BACL|nr:APC family permease [Brevibacillus fluminis]RNB80220.1 APC family permease [Brevibacillus fluminis]
MNGGQGKGTSLQGSLSLGQVIFFGLAFLAPISIFSIYGVAIQSSKGMIATAYVIASVVMLFTAYSYGMLVKAFPTAGAAYSFAQKSIHSNVGFIVGWTIILDYMFCPLISALFFGIFITSYFPAIPFYVVIIFFVTVITVVNVLGIKIAANFNALLLTLQIIFCISFIALSVKGLLDGKGMGTLVSTIPFFDPNVKMASLLSIVPLLSFTYLGFDAVTTLAEETKNPRKTLPKAMFLITLIASLLFIAISYFAQLVYTDIDSFIDPESASMQIFAYIGGNIFVSIFVAIWATAGLASAVASSSSAARVLYVMGREHVLPYKFFGYLSPKYHTPVFNLLLVAVVAMGALVLDVLTVTSFINFGALFAFTMVNLSVISHYFIKQKKRSGKDIILYLILPLIGAFFTGLFLIKLDFHSLLLGGLWLACGLIYLIFLTKRFRQPLPDFSDSGKDSGQEWQATSE